MRWLSAGVIVVLMASCGGEDSRPQRLANGGSGTGASGGTSSGGSAGASGSGGAAGSAGSAGSGGAVGELVTTGSALVGFFYDADALYFAHEAGVTRTDWDGVEVSSWTSPRLLITADYDGEHFIAGDAGAISVLDHELAFQRESTLTEPCDRGVVLVSNGRVVCGGVTTDTFYTLSVSDGSLLGAIEDEGFGGGPVRRVPGQDLFFSNSVGSSPRDYFLYRVEADDSVNYLGESPYHGDFDMTTIVGFLGEPVSHLITHEGNQLRMLTADCDAQVNDSSCFTQDGNLGTLPGTDSRYVGFSQQMDGTLFALATLGDAFSVYREPCFEQSCELQRIDVATKQVVARTSLRTVENRNAFYLAPLPDGSGVILVVSGRSIYESAGSSESLPYEVYRYDLPAE